MSLSIKHDHLDLPGYWRLCWFGALSKHPDHPSNDCIHAYLGKIKGLTDDHKWDARLLSDTYHSRLVPIAEVPRIFINGIFKDGVLQDASGVSGEHQASITISFDGKNRRVIHRFENDEQGKPFIPYHRSPLLQNTFDVPFDVRDSSVLGSRLNPQSTGFLVLARDTLDNLYAFPCFEIFRFFYATTSHLAVATLAGHFRVPDQYLWDSNRSKLEDRKAFLYVRRGILDTDVRQLARFAFDAVAIAEATRIANLVSSGISYGSERVLVARPPIETPVELKIIFLECENKTRIVTRILSCDWRPPFDELFFAHEGGGFSEDDAELSGLPTIDWPRRRFIHVKPNDSKPRKLARAGATKSLPPRGIAESELSERFPYLSNVIPTKIKQPPSEQRKGKSSVELVNDDEEVSVIVGSGSSDRLREARLTEDVSIHEKSVSQAVSSNQVDSMFEEPDQDEEETSRSSLPLLHRMLLMLQVAKRAPKAHLIKEIMFVTATDQYSMVEGEKVGVLPVEIAGKKRAWCLIDEEKKLQRLVFVAEIHYDGADNTRVRYVIEFQQKHSHECSTLIIWSKDESSIPLGELRQIVLKCAASTKDSVRVRCARAAQELGMNVGSKRHVGIDFTKKAIRGYLLQVLLTKPVIVKVAQEQETDAALRED